MPLEGKRRVLVTGGAGFIGTNLVDRLVREGHEVTIFDDLSRAGAEKNDRLWGAPAGSAGAGCRWSSPPGSEGTSAASGSVSSPRRRNQSWSSSPNSSSTALESWVMLAELISGVVPLVSASIRCWAREKIPDLWPVCP